MLLVRKPEKYASDLSNALWVQKTIVKSVYMISLWRKTGYLNSKYSFGSVTGSTLLLN